MKKPRHKKKEQFGQWILIRFLNGGGNGEVWEVVNEKKEKGAIKLLKTVSRKSYLRFKDEIEVVRKNSDIKGLLPILEYHMPTDLKDGTPWYVMPLAIPLAEHLKKESAITIINNFIALSATLISLHQRNISHRDIKPGNLFQLNGIPCFGDFGLVEYPNKNDLTQKGESVGPKWTMAPEMRRYAEKADGIPADIYSFAKTLWIILTKQVKGFDGQYGKETINALKIFQPTIYYGPLDNLFTKCTDDDPCKRPNADEFQKLLTDWLKANEDFHLRNTLQWKDIQNEIFPSKPPTRVIWEDIESIVYVLKKLSFTNDLCHVFIPSGGGSDLHDARRSYEDNCIELDFGHTLICKPQRLIYESFDYDEEWNYFRLECDNLEPSNYYPEVYDREPLTELEPLVYTDVNCLEFNDFNGNKLPDGARSISRILIRCSFVIFRKTSMYNKVTSTYDARHNKMSTDEFREYIGTEVRRLKANDNPSQIKIKSIQLIQPTTYRTKNRLLTDNEVHLLRTIISLAQHRDAEYRKIENKFGMEEGLSSWSKNYDAYLTEPRPKAKDLENYLKKLSKEHLSLVAAVMYGGRECSPPWGTPLDIIMNHVKANPDLDESISEKISLVEYLERGIKLYTSD